MTVLNEPQHQNDEAARTWFEKMRWPDGVVCPHCGTLGTAYARSKPGLYRCAERECRKDFTVTTKSVMQSSHIPLRLWAQAFTLLCSSKKGMSAHQIHRTLKITYKSAWFLCHRIRLAMKSGGLEPLGGEGKIIESDETYWGPKDVDTNPAMKRRRRGKPGPGGKARIMTLVERGGRARSVHVSDLTNETMQNILLANADRKSRLMTDEGTSPSIGLLFASHETVKHSAYEYARGDVTTNTVEGYFGVFKRGMRGTYQHCKEKHLHRYLSEFDFRYNYRMKLGYNDGDRAALAAKNAAGKRLTYRQPH
jgi:transposase-like protein